MPTELQHHTWDNPWGSTPHLAGALWHERGSRCFVFLVAAIIMPGECRQDYRIEHPAQAGRSGVQAAPRVRKGAE